MVAAEDGASAKLQLLQHGIILPVTSHRRYTYGRILNNTQYEYKSYTD